MSHTLTETLALLIKIKYMSIKPDPKAVKNWRDLKNNVFNLILDNLIHNNSAAFLW